LLRARRFQSVEATALLARVITEIDAAIFAFDARATLQLVNRAGETLLGAPQHLLVGHAAGDLGLQEYLTGETPRVVEAAFRTKAGRWEIRRSAFRQGGRPHELLVINDLSAVLREEERQAWQRLVRVLSHEINNSLAPIKSIADSLQATYERNGAKTGAAGAGADEDFRAGLAVIASRSEALRRFMASYARLARLPPPSRRDVDLAELVQRVARLEHRRAVLVNAGPPVTLHADGDQLEQLLINLVSNAVDAAAETDGGVTISWEAAERHVEVRVDDEGPGLPDPANLFVPFFTTKPAGSGIGLLLSRQIAEAHGGSLVVRDRTDRRGCRARLRLPR
jgi:two-component system nitrogen regulation sensor histidine kinase NtrY